MDSTAMMFRQMGGVNLDIDATFFIQLGLIVLTMLVLRKLVFQPYLRVSKIREDLTTKTAERAEETNARAKVLAEDFDAKLQAAKQDALELKSALRAEGLQTKDQILSEASDRANTELASAREKLAAEIGDVRAASQGLVDDLSSAIVAKVLGRPSDTFSGQALSSSPSTEEEVQP